MNTLVTRLQQIKSWQWLLIAYLVAMPLLFRPTLHGSDPLGYYSWLRSAVLDFDLNVNNEFTDLGFTAYFNTFTPTGYRVNHWSIGPAVLWAPFYLITHAIVSLLTLVGGPWPADGYSLPYTFTTALASTLYVLASLFLLRDISKQYVSSGVATLATLGVWFASSLLFYMYSSPMMSHAVDFFINALFIWVWYRTCPEPTWRGWLGRGLCIGLAILIRPQNFLLAIVPSIEFTFWFFKHPAPFPARIQVALQRGLAFSTGILIFVGLQVTFWRVVFGQWIVSAYTLIPDVPDTNALFNFASPRLLQLAFSTDRGIFFWAPILIFGFIGLFMLIRRDKSLATLLLVIFATQFYFISSAVWWNGGGTSFGSRVLVGVLPVFVIGLAIFFGFLMEKEYVSFNILIVITGLFILWNFLLIIQYALGTVPRNGTFSVAEMVRNQFMIIPNNLTRIIQALITR